jgi:hypothetical protein
MISQTTSSTMANNIYFFSEKVQHSVSNVYPVTIIGSNFINSPLNKVPTVSLAASLRVKAGTAINNLYASATDADRDNITFSCQGLPADATYVEIPQTAVYNKKLRLAWTPGYNAIGIHTLTCTASDGKERASKQMRLEVYDGNRAPVVSLVNSVSIRAGTLLRFTASAADADLDPITFQCVNCGSYSSLGLQISNIIQPYNYKKALSASWQTTAGLANRYFDLQFKAADARTATVKLIRVNILE